MCKDQFQANKQRFFCPTWSMLFDAILWLFFAAGLLYTPLGLATNDQTPSVASPLYPVTQKPFWAKSIAERATPQADRGYQPWPVSRPAENEQQTLQSLSSRLATDDADRYDGTFLRMFSGQEPVETTSKKTNAVCAKGFQFNNNTLYCEPSSAQK
jgi:hypothetical protein